MYRYLKKIIGVGSGDYIYFWKSKGLPDETITPPITSDDSLTPKLSYFGTKTRLEFNGRCSKQDKITYTHGKTVHIYIVYEINKNFPISRYPTLGNFLFGAVSLTKSNNIEKYKYSGYGIGFDRKGKFSVVNGFGKNCIIFVVHISSSVLLITRKKVL